MVRGYWTKYDKNNIIENPNLIYDINGAKYTLRLYDEKKFTLTRALLSIGYKLKDMKIKMI